MVYHGVASKKYGLNFYFSPKCACTITRQLWYKCHPEDIIQISKDWHEIEKDFPAPLNNAAGFLIIRDPFDRAVSMYTGIVCSSDVTQEIRDFLGIGESRKISFIDFCRYLVDRKRHNWENTNLHFLPQTYIPSQYHNVLRKDDFTNGNLHLIKCEQNIFHGIDEFYRQHLSPQQYTLIKNRITQFMMESHCNNSTKHDNYATLPTDCTHIYMWGWKSYPSYDRFKNPTTIKLIKEAYDDDYSIFKY